LFVRIDFENGSRTFHEWDSCSEHPTIQQGVSDVKIAHPTIGDIARILEGEIICGEDNLGHEVSDVGATDLLSDLLAMNLDNYALLTGLNNPQVIRTAEITNACCVVILRGKKPDPATISVAKRSGIPLILSTLRMFEACSRLGLQLELKGGSLEPNGN
jgi:predicted transcriptional regulator